MVGSQKLRTLEVNWQTKNMSYINYICSASETLTDDLCYCRQSVMVLVMMEISSICKHACDESWVRGPKTIEATTISRY